MADYSALADLSVPADISFDSPGPIPTIVAPSPGTFTAGPDAPSYFDTPQGAATMMGIAGIGQAVASEFMRREQNKQREAYKARIQEQARAATTSRLDDLRRANEKAEVQSRIQTAKVNRAALMNRAATMVRGGMAGVGGTTASQVVAQEELRQARVLAGIEGQLRLSRQDTAQQARGIFTQERSRMLQATQLQPSGSTLAPDLIGAGLQVYSSYLQFNAAQDKGIDASVKATS